MKRLRKVSTDTTVAEIGAAGECGSRFVLLCVLFCGGDRVDVDGLLALIGGGVDGDVLAVEGLDGIRVVDRPDCLFILIDEDWLLAALDAFFGAGGAGAGVLGAAHGVGDPAVDGGGVGGVGRDGGGCDEEGEQGDTTFHGDLGEREMVYRKS